MTKLFSKISASLLVPVVFGAVCLSCVVRPLPVLAVAPVDPINEIQQDKACVEYKNSAEITIIPTILPVAFNMTKILAVDQSPFAEHDLYCRTLGDNAIIDGNVLLLGSRQMMTVILLQISVGINDFQDQKKPLDFYKIKPDKIDFITGCVIKLE